MDLPVHLLLLAVLSTAFLLQRWSLRCEALRPTCTRCCRFSEKQVYSPLYIKNKDRYLAPKIHLNIDITILKGDKGEKGEGGMTGISGTEGLPGPHGLYGEKGQKGNTGAPGHSCKQRYSVFSVGRRKSLHSSDDFQHVTFDTEYVNPYKHFNMLTGRFFCYIAGTYFFNLNVHSWNLKETYLHIMKTDEKAAILYAQPSDRSIMQSQSLMLELGEGDQVWVRMFKRERHNAIFNEESDVYVTFNGHLIMPNRG